MGPLLSPCSSKIQGGTRTNRYRSPGVAICYGRHHRARSGCCGRFMDHGACSGDLLRCLIPQHEASSLPEKESSAAPCFMDSPPVFRKTCSTSSSSIPPSSSVLLSRIFACRHLHLRRHHRRSDLRLQDPRRLICDPAIRKTNANVVFMILPSCLPFPAKQDTKQLRSASARPGPRLRSAFFFVVADPI